MASRVTGSVTAGLLAMVIASTSGCSFFLVDGPSPDRPRTEEPRCTRVPMVPILDAVGALLFVGGGIVARSDDYSGGQSVEIIGPSASIPLISIGVVAGVAAVWGFVKFKRCNDAYTDYQLQLQSGTRVP